jgi:hypothetical protein
MSLNLRVAAAITTEQLLKLEEKIQAAATNLFGGDGDDDYHAKLKKIIDYNLQGIEDSVNDDYGNEYLDNRAKQCVAFATYLSVLAKSSIIEARETGNSDRLFEAMDFIADAFIYVGATGEHLVAVVEKSEWALLAINARHNKPGGSRDKKSQICGIWATGKYTSRDICAEQECAALDMSFSTARKALRNTPDPQTT